MARPRSTPASGLDVIVTDHDWERAESLAARLRGLGASVRVAYESGMAVREAIHRAPDVVFVEFDSPPASALSLARLIRHNLALSEAKLIGTFSVDPPSPGIVVLAREAGFDLCVSELLEPERLLWLVAGLQ